MIQVDHLTKSFGWFKRFKAVDDLSFTVDSGEALALWGVNGAGKTTVLRCILGLLPCQGAITIDGKDARRYGKAARRALGYVPQELCLHDDLRCLEALHFYGRLKRADMGRCRKVLAEVGLADAGSKRVRELSGGMKQRLALAVALLAEPEVLLLDELTASLDQDARAGFIALLQQLKRRGMTMLFTSHRIDEVEALADRVLVMANGRKRIDCPANALAEALGVRSVLRLIVADGSTQQAVDHLVGCGYPARANGVGLYVHVRADEKAMPIRRLAEAAIAVRDFDFIANNVDPWKEEAHE